MSDDLIDRPALIAALETERRRTADEGVIEGIEAAIEVVRQAGQREPDDGPDVRVGRIEGGWAYWCADCKKGQAAKQGVSMLDRDVIEALVEMHEADHRLGRPLPLPLSGGEAS